MSGPPFHHHLGHKVRAEVRDSRGWVSDVWRASYQPRIASFQTWLIEREIKILLKVCYIVSLWQLWHWSSQMCISSTVLPDSSWRHIVSSNILEFLTVSSAFKDLHLQIPLQVLNEGVSFSIIVRVLLSAVQGSSLVQDHFLHYLLILEFSYFSRV